MTESNKQSNLLRNLALSVAPEDYLINKAKIAEAKTLISTFEEMNEAGKQSHDEFARELEQKIREGEQARMLLEQLRSKSTVQVPPSMPIQRPVVDYPSSTSRIEEVPNYDSGSGHLQQVQYHQLQGATNNQQIHKFVPQATVQPVESSSFQQLSAQQRTPVNTTHSEHKSRQSQQTSHQLPPYSQQNVMQNSSSRATYAPLGFQSNVHPQQRPTGQDQGKHDNYSRPMAPTQEQRHVPSHQENLHYDIATSNQGQLRTTTSTPQVQAYSSLQTIPAQAPCPSNTTRPLQFAQQSSTTQKSYAQAVVSQNQATASSATFPQWPSPHKARNIDNQSQIPATTAAASRPAALGQQPKASSSDDYDSSSNSAIFGRPTNPVPVIVGTFPNPISSNPQTKPKDDGTNQAATHGPQPLQLIVPTLPSLGLDPAQYIHEFREVIKSWEVNVPPNSYFDHPSNRFKVFKDHMGVTRIIVGGDGQSRVWTGDVDRFCDRWLQGQKTTTTSGSQQPSVTPIVSANSQSDSSSFKQTQSTMSMNMHTQGITSSTQKATPTTLHKATPSAVHKGSVPLVQTTSSFAQFQTVQRSEDPQPGGSSSKQTPPTMSTSKHNERTTWLTPQIATPSTSQITTSSTSATQLFPSSASQVRPLPPSMTQPPPSISVPETPSRQLSTIVKGVPRSVKQADKKFLASHILFGLGKRPRESDTSSTALTEPEPKRHAQQATGQATQAVQELNVPLQITPTRALVVSSSRKQPPAIPQETQQTSQAFASASSGDQQQPVNVILGIPYTSKTAAAASTETSEVSKASSDQTPLSLQDATALPVKQNMQVALSVGQPDSQQEIIPDDHPVIPLGASVPQHWAAAGAPLATSSTIAQTATLPLPIPLTAPVAISPPLSSGVNENTTYPVASSTLKQLPQPNVLAKPRCSFIDVTSPVPSPLDSMAATSAEMPQTNQPLFLPSPASSPGIAKDDISISVAQSANMTSPSFDPRNKFSNSAKRKNRAYVLAPPRPEYLVKYWRLEKQKMSRASLKRIRMTPRSSVSTSVAGEEDFYNAPESHSPSFGLDPYEQQAVRWACSRLQKLSCKWDGCSVKMNSVDALIRHLNRQHKPSSTSHSDPQYFLCRWTQCGRRCNLHEKHLEKHAFLPLNCPYKDCDKSFRCVPPLCKHMRAEHKNSGLKPSAQPSYPKLEPPAAIPGVIPSYMIATRRADPHIISSARHAVVGPHVLRNIAGLERERLTRNKSRKGDISDEDTSNDYDFLTMHPTRYSSNLSQPVDMKVEDLNSESISKMVDEGLTLWGGEEEPMNDEYLEDLMAMSPSYSDESPTFGRREHRSDQDEMLTEMIAV